jgi:copper chaperone CopZ
MSATELEIKGMTCADCAAHVTAALRKAGAEEISIDWRCGTGAIAADGPTQAEMNGRWPALATRSSTSASRPHEMAHAPVASTTTV